MGRLSTFIRHHPRRSIALAGGLCSLALIGWLLTGPSTDALESYNECTNAGYPVTDTNPPLCDAGRRTFLGPPTPTPSALPALTNLSYQLLVSGNSGGAYPARQQVITAPAAWQQYWGAVHAGLPTLPPILPINFATNDVVAISTGIQMTTGYTLKIDALTSSTAGTQVLAAESVPSIGCPVANTHTNPYLIVSTPKLPAPVHFQLSIEHRHCQN